MRDIVPELHDIAKLWHLTEEMQSRLGLRTRSVQTEIAQLPVALGLTPPNTTSWPVILHHHDEPGGDTVQFVFQVADHAGSNFGRHLHLNNKMRNEILTNRPKDATPRDIHQSLHKLWNPAARQPLKLLETEEDLRALLDWLSSGPDRAALWSRYGHLLEARPEELTPPLNVTSLASHLEIVGRIYRFLQKRVSENPDGKGWLFCGRPAVQTTKSAEKDWTIRLVKGKITFAQQIVRTRDMAVFDALQRAREAMQQQDRLLMTSFDEMILLCDPTEPIEDVFAPIVNAGFAVRWQAAPTAIAALPSTPEVLRRQRLAEIMPQVDTVPLGKRAQNLSGRLRDYPLGTAIRTPLATIAGDICDLCQMEPAVALWPTNPDMPGPREHLGQACLDVRKTASRCHKLDRWTDEGTSRVAWVLLRLDLGRLADWLLPLYQQHARDCRWPPHLVEQIAVTPPLALEFQKDYQRLIAGFAEAVERSVGGDNIEYVGGTSGEAAHSLFCVRIDAPRDVLSLLRLYQEQMRTLFPVLLQPPLPPHLPSPIQLAISSAGVKFPFSEHWRLMSEGTDDVIIRMVGSGAVGLPIASLPFLLATDSRTYRSALHNLAEVAHISEGLARLYMDDREQKGHGQYEDWRRRLAPLGLRYESIITFSRLMEG